MDSSIDPREWTLVQRLKESSHPIAVLFYVTLRLMPIALYLFGMFFTSNFVLMFILIALSLAVDFWNVKNIAGRYLVGMRWWNETTEDGSSIWSFETSPASRYINPIDSNCFWVLLYAVLVVWGVLGFVAVIKFRFVWFLVVILALVLSKSNLSAFIACNRESTGADSSNRFAQIPGRLSELSGAAFSVGSRLFGR